MARFIEFREGGTFYPGKEKLINVDLITCIEPLSFTSGQEATIIYFNNQHKTVFETYKEVKAKIDIITGNSPQEDIKE